MTTYILKRLLLMVPTLLGVLMLTFVVIQFVPGGPVEQMVSQLQGRDGGGEGAAASGAGYRGRQGVDAARIEEIKHVKPLLQNSKVNHLVIDHEAQFFEVFCIGGYDPSHRPRVV